MSRLSLNIHSSRRMVRSSAALCMHTASTEGCCDGQGKPKDAATIHAVTSEESYTVSRRGWPWVVIFICLANNSYNIWQETTITHTLPWGCLCCCFLIFAH